MQRKITDFSTGHANAQLRSNLRSICCKWQLGIKDNDIKRQCNDISAIPRLDRLESHCSFPRCGWKMVHIRGIDG